LKDSRRGNSFWRFKEAGTSYSGGTRQRKGDRRFVVVKGESYFSRGTRRAVTGGRKKLQMKDSGKKEDISCGGSVWGERRTIVLKGGGRWGGKWKEHKTEANLFA